MSDQFIRLRSYPSIENVSVALPWMIYFRQSGGQEWEIANSLFFPEQMDWSCNGAVSQASIIFRSGLAFNNVSSSWQTVLPAAIDRSFVKIRVGSILGENRLWFGQVDGASAEVLGHSEPSPSVGTLQRFYAFGIEQLLGNIFVTSSRYFDTARMSGPTSGVGASAPETIPEGLTFNDRGLPNMTAFKWLGSYYFNPHRSTSLYWTTQQIVRYLLREFQIPSVIYREVESHINRLPNFDRPVVPTHGRRVIEIINQLVNQRRGYCWWLAYVEDRNSDLGKNDYYTFQSSTFNLVDTELGSPSDWIIVPKIPANTNRIRIDTREDAGAETILVDDESSKVDEVLVQGAKRTVTFTVSFNDDAIDGVRDQKNGTKYWTDAQQEIYLTGDVAASVFGNHIRRQRDAVFREQKFLRNVFELFGLDLTKKFPPYSSETYQGSWNAVTNTPSLANGSGDAGDWYDVSVAGAWDFGNGLIRFGVGDVVVYDGQFWKKGTIPAFGQGISPFNLKLLSGLPLFEGADYSGDKVSQNKVIVPDTLISRPIFVIIDVKSSIGEENKFLPVESIGRLGTDPPITKGLPKFDWSANVEVVEGTPTFRIRIDGAPKWIIAKNAPTALPPHNKPKPELDWQKLRATVSLEDDQRCEYRYPPGGNFARGFTSAFTDSFRKAAGAFTKGFTTAFTRSSGSRRDRQLVINVGDGYRADYLIPGTIVDVDSVGKPVRSSGGWLQNDTSTLEIVARAAFDFYSKPRREMQLSCDFTPEAFAFSIGALITQVAVGRIGQAFFDEEVIQQSIWRTVNSVITHLSLEIPWTISDETPSVVGQPRLMVTTSTGVFDAEDLLEMARRGGRK